MIKHNPSQVSNLVATPPAPGWGVGEREGGNTKGFYNDMPVVNMSLHPFDE